MILYIITILRTNFHNNQPYSMSNNKNCQNSGRLSRLALKKFTIICYYRYVCLIYGNNVNIQISGGKKTMVELIKSGAWLAYGTTLIVDDENAAAQLKSLGKDGRFA